MINCWTRLVNWVCHIEKASVPFNRFLDFSRLTSVALRTRYVFAFARKRTEQFAGVTPAKSALFSEDWVGFGIAQLYESLMKETPIEARAFRERATAIWLGVPAEILKLEDKPGPPHWGLPSRSLSLARNPFRKKNQCSSDTVLLDGL